VEYPDIKALSLDIGTKPTSYKPNGDGHYTLPTILDPNTGKVVAESYDIAQYLDATYPERPVIPPGMTGLQHAFHLAISDAIYEVCVSKSRLLFFTSLKQCKQALYEIIILGVHNILNPRSQEYFRRTREENNIKLEERSPVGPTRDEQFKSLQKGFTRLAKCYEKNGNDSKFIMGNQISYGDFLVASWLLCAERAIGQNEWDEIMKFDEGRWKRLLKGLDEYTSTDEGEEYQVKEAERR
jgi:glutathione S-transferase